MASTMKGRKDELKGDHLRHSCVNGVDIYTITSQQRSIPAWISDKNQKSRKAKPKEGDKIALLQDLWFDTSTAKIKPTPDGEYLIASGIYPPQIKTYELSQLSMKFERHFDSEILDFQILTDDYSKMAFLCADRSINLHAKYGHHYTLRVPRMGRDLEYDYWSCDLLCAASSPDVYRINLEQGRFLSSLTTQSPGVNVVSRSKVHGLVSCGGEDGSVECFDMRLKSSVGRINAVASVGDYNKEVTAIEFDGDADYQMAVGTSSGKVLIYDLRSSNPVLVKDHMYENPILDIKWHRTLNSPHPKLITTDSRIVRIWNPQTGEGMTSIEPAGGKINDLCIFPGTGLIILALDGRQIPSYFIPELGPAPKWSPRLQLWEELELEENKESVVYDNYRFLTREDLEKLNITKLIGSDALKAYMHGYFINYKLYKKVKELANPFSYEEYTEQKKQEKLDKEHANRITTKRKLPKVNRNLANKILDNEEAENEKKDEDDKESKKDSKKRKKALSTDILKDDRFAELFENEEFEIDEESKEYLALHPVAPTKNQPSMIEEHFDAVSDDDENEDDDEASSSGDEKRAQAPRLHEIKDDRHAEAFVKKKSLAKEDSMVLGERRNDAKRSFSNDIKFGAGGSRELTFKSRNWAKYKEDEVDEEPRRDKRRGVQSLGLKSGRGRGRGGFGGGGGRGRGGSGGGGRGRGGGGRGRGGGGGASRGGGGGGRRGR